MTPRKTSILVLDDEHEIRSEINEFLISRDFQVSEASKPASGCRGLFSEAFHFE
jgi:DNA-binding response OmpR family regulator